jgi:hypothetical protein
LLTAFDVPIRRLDSYDIRNVGFIKIDVEGHEEDVLIGANVTIKRERPVLLIEIEERHNPQGLTRIVDGLKRLDYDAYFFENKKLKPIGAFDVKVHQVVSAELESDPPIRSRRHIAYVNNFLFLPRNERRS